MTSDDAIPGLGRAVLVVPTYNEAENLPAIVARLRRAQPLVHVLVVEDNSPDGTGAVADRLAADDPHVEVLHRQGKEGLGAAYLHGFAVALQRGYDVVGEMDADGSHAPEQLQRLLDALQDADLVIGSRYVPGGRVVNWPWHRQLLSRGGNVYTRLLLGMPVRKRCSIGWPGSSLGMVGSGLPLAKPMLPNFAYGPEWTGERSLA